LAPCINQGQGGAYRFHNPLFVEGFHQILKYTETDSLFGIVEFVQRCQQNELGSWRGLANGLDGFDAIDPRHVDVHDRQVRVDQLRLGDRLTTRVGDSDLAVLAIMLLDDKRQRIEHDLFIVRQ